MCEVSVAIDSSAERLLLLGLGLQPWVREARSVQPHVDSSTWRFKVHGKQTSATTPVILPRWALLSRFPLLSASGHPPKGGAAQILGLPSPLSVGRSPSLPSPSFPPPNTSFFMGNIDPLRGSLIFAKCFVSYYFVDTFNCTVTFLWFM